MGLGPLVDYGIAPIFLLFVMKLNLVFVMEGQPALYPTSKDGDLFIGKFALRGHLMVFVLIRNHLKKQASFRFVQIDSGTDFSSVQNTLPCG